MYESELRVLYVEYYFLELFSVTQELSGESHGIVVNMLVGKFKFQSHYYIHFQTNTLGKGIKPQLWVKLVPLLFFHKNDFGIK